MFERFWLPVALGILVLMAVLLAGLEGCAFRYNKQTGGYEGAVACVNITGPGFSWTCTEQSTVPTLPDSQKLPEAPAK